MTPPTMLDNRIGKKRRNPYISNWSIPTQRNRCVGGVMTPPYDWHTLFRMNENGIRVGKAQLILGDLANALHGTDVIDLFLKVGVFALHGRRLLRLSLGLCLNTAVHPLQGRQRCHGEEDQHDQGDFQACRC